ncbi:MAG TPA: DUF4202 domain-containing protein [Polyangiaceae bacterium]
MRAFDQANAEDPNRILDGGVLRPRELVDAERLSRWVERLAPDASEALRLAARCQHIRRWESPRATYPEGRIGYLAWRKALSRFHAKTAGEILRGAGYDDRAIERIRFINEKKSLKMDPDVQTMEDALCLVFLEYEIEEFATKHPEDKLIDILRKTWCKMSDRGHAEALALPMSAGVLGLVKRALGAA